MQNALLTTVGKGLRAPVSLAIHHGRIARMPLQAIVAASRSFVSTPPARVPIFPDAPTRDAKHPQYDIATGATMGIRIGDQGRPPPRSYDHTTGTYPTALPLRSERKVTETIRADHRSISELHERFWATPPQNERERQAIINELVREISVHAEAEEIVVYPIFEANWVEGAGVAESRVLREEHRQLRKELRQLEKLDVDYPYFADSLKRVMRIFWEHSKHEEEVELPALERRLTAQELRAMNLEFEMTKSISPTHPHPLAPQRPPVLKQAVGAATAAIDKAYDSYKPFAERRIK
ncbi:hypothetical protein HK102_001805 [Quaeritorhiza haematococci]|nr:hypothetical protein HK102_001805 [Quaeritorhiza haematococci]